MKRERNLFWGFSVNAEMMANPHPKIPDLKFFSFCVIHEKICDYYEKYFHNFPASFHRI